jgi:SAM-dependent methyltransferase
LKKYPSLANQQTIEGDVFISMTNLNRTPLAAYYTPPAVAQALTNWAIREAEARVLDPSYGGCAFLQAAFATLRQKGALTPAKHIFGIDLDPSAEKFLAPLLTAGAASTQYLQRDFFNVSLGDFDGAPFDVVVGNPPYIRYHDIPAPAQQRAVECLAQYGMQISGRASYWAFFLLYSMQFLKPGGRLAMLLPGALLHTDYAVQVRELLIRHFEKVNIYLLHERIFAGTQEESVIVCAEGASRPNTSVHVTYLPTVNDLQQINHTAPSPANAVNGNHDQDGGWLRALLDQNSLAIYDSIAQMPSVIRLGDWVETRIGVVTGNNNFFILSQAERARRKIPARYFIPVLRRPAQLAGLYVTNQNLQFLAEENKAYLLLNPPEKLSQMPKTLRQYLEEGEAQGVHLAWKCRARKPWYIVPHTAPPAAFIPCMAASWARLTANRSSFTCTNNILRLSWKNRRPALDWTRLALGSLSTFCQLSAELVGRSYGGGVLKLEPTELTRLAIPLIHLEETPRLARTVHKLLQQNNSSAATSAVDAVLINSNPQYTQQALQKIRTLRDQLFLRRREHRQDAERILKNS